jgi:ribosome-associated protein
MLQITDHIAIDESELQLDFVRASGPGGQNVNKVSSAVQLRYDVLRSPALPEEVRERLVKIAGSRMTNDGVLIIEANQHRTQEQNRQEALNRLAALVQQAARPPKPRHKTKPSAAARARRLDAKRRRSQTKMLRQRPTGDIES